MAFLHHTERKENKDRRLSQVSCEGKQRLTEQIDVQWSESSWWITCVSPITSLQSQLPFWSTNRRVFTPQLSVTLCQTDSTTLSSVTPAFLYFPPSVLLSVLPQANLHQMRLQGFHPRSPEPLRKINSLLVLIDVRATLSPRDCSGNNVWSMSKMLFKPEKEWSYCSWVTNKLTIININTVFKTMCHSLTRKMCSVYGWVKQWHFLKKKKKTTHGLFIVLV